MPRDPAFEVSVAAEDVPTETLLLSVSNLGLAGLTAVDHLVKGQDATEIGYVRTENVPDVTPFEEGVPRLPVRLYAVPEFDLTALVGELFVPAWAADPFAEAVRGWAESAGVEEITVLHGVPYPHGPDDHDVFYVSSPAYRADRLADVEIGPLTGGYLDGVVGELVTGSLEGAGPPVGALVTPSHPPGPDFEASLRFLEAIERVHGVAIDEADLRRRADEMQRHYRELAARLEQLESEDQPLRSRDFPDDRMFM